MCSIGEDDFGDEGGLHIMIKEENISTDISDEICKKCNKDKSVVKLLFKESQCKECFFLYVRHKFRASLGASKLVPRESNVLIIFDGKPENIVLLDMLNYALNQAAFKRLHFNVTVLYIDETSVENSSEESRLAHLEEVKMIINQFNFKTFYASVAKTDYDDLKKLNEILNFKEFESIEEDFQKKLISIKTLTSRQEYLRLTKQNICFKCAKILNCKFVFHSEIIADLAKTLLTNISLGRGSSVALDVSFFDDRLSDVKSIRPIKDLNEHEVMSYIKLTNLKYLKVKTFGKDNGEYASIQNLTSKFIDGLQVNFPSTISTIFRTGDKMCSKGKHNINNDTLENIFSQNCQVDNKCSYCKANLDFHESDTLYAIEYSRLVSANKIANLNQDDVRKAVNGIDDDGDKTNVKSKLCHGCRNILRDFDGNLNFKNVFL